MILAWVLYKYNSLNIDVGIYIDVILNLLLQYMFFITFIFDKRPYMILCLYSALLEEKVSDSLLDLTIFTNKQLFTNNIERNVHDMCP